MRIDFVYSLNQLNFNNRKVTDTMAYNSIRIGIVNRIPRLIIPFKTINNYTIILREFYFPSRISTFLELVSLVWMSFKNHHIVNGTNEAGVWISHLRLTKSTDKILAVGIGYGTTLVPVVKLLDTGKYTCIEASQTQIEKALTNIKLNNLDNDKYEIIHGFAGNDKFGVYGESSNIQINIDEYEIDILELDCEGSEISILRSLSSKPRNIILELHQYYYPPEFKTLDSFLNFMCQKGYVIDFFVGHNGDFIDKTIANKLYSESHNKSLKCNTDSNLAVFRLCPIVAAFKLDLSKKTNSNN